MLSLVGKLYKYGLQELGRDKCAMGEEQCRFRHGRGCTNQMFVIREVCEST